MDEEKLPWWRRALSYALDGIRSGFGLFSRPKKEKAANHPEIIAGQEEYPEEDAELNEESPAFVQISETVIESQPVVFAAAESGVLEPPIEAEGIRETDQRDENGQRLSEESEKHASGAEALVDSVGLVPGLKSQPTAGTSFSADIESDGEAEDVDVAAAEVEEQIGESHEPEPASSTPAPQEEQEIEAAVEAVAAETSTNEFAEESAAAIETPNEPEVEAEIRDEPLNAPAVNGVAEVAYDTSAEIAFEASAEVAGQGSPEHETIEDSVVENEAPVEVSAEEEAVIETVEEPRESLEQVAEAEPEADAIAEPAMSEEITFADEPGPELADSSVELNEPAIDWLPEQAVGQPEADEAAIDEADIIDEAAAVTEAAPEDAVAELAAPEAELVAEEVPEPVNEPMEWNEPINEPAREPVPEPVPEPATEPTAASETAPVAEAVTEAIPDEVDSTRAEVVADAFAGVAPAEEEPDAEPEPKQAAPAKPFIKLETRDNEADLSPFSVVVSEVYDGPLDLLLDLIRKQDIDIYDIPIARITAQFLAYVNQLKATDVDVAGEFIYTASLLIHIKSKMLLPRAPAGPDEAAEDPRRELVERLLEHERFKNAAQMLQQKQMLEAASWTNPGMREFKDDESAEPEIAADTVDLVRVFRDILERARNRPVINVQEDSVTVGQMIQFLARRLTMEDKPVALRRLLSHTRSERSLIAMFLALLELVRLQAILLRQDRAFSEIFIKKHTGFESVMNNDLASARDDWR